MNGYHNLENVLHGVPINHTTYHHFTNNGLSDSTIDILLFLPTHIRWSPGEHCRSYYVVGPTPVLTLVMMLLYPLLLFLTKDNIVAPKIKHTKHKIIWTDEGMLQYQMLVSKTLPTLQTDYCEVSEPEVASVLFQITNHILTDADKKTNKSIDIGRPGNNSKPTGHLVR